MNIKEPSGYLINLRHYTRNSILFLQFLNRFRFGLGVLACVVLAGFLLNLTETSGQATTTSSTVSISVEVPEAVATTSEPTTSSGGYTVPSPGPARLVLEGFTSPLALVYFYANNSLLGTDKADVLGNFSRVFSTNSGINNISLASKDTHGLFSSTSNLSMNLLVNATTTVSHIFLSPTIATKRNNAPIGVPIIVTGSVFPGSTVYAILDNDQIDEITADAKGRWTYSLATKSLRGDYLISVRAFIGDLGLISPLSSQVTVSIGETTCPGPNLNEDGEVDIADLSIMLYYWREVNPENQCADLNFDGTVDIADISLLMFAWSGSKL